MFFNINNIGFNDGIKSCFPSRCATNARNNELMRCVQTILKQQSYKEVSHFESLPKMQQATAAKAKKHKHIKHASPHTKKKAHKVHKTTHKKIKKAHKSHKAAKKKNRAPAKQQTIHRVNKKSSKKLKKKSKHTHYAAQKALHKRHKGHQAVPIPSMPLSFPDEQSSYAAIPLVEDVAAGDERWTHFRTQYPLLMPLLPANIRTQIDQALSQGNSFTAFRQRCWEIVQTVIRDRINNFQSDYFSLSLIVQDLFPQYPDMISFTHQADELLQCARQLMQAQIGAPAQAYVTQTMHELSSTLSFDRIKEAARRFGKMLYIQDMGNPIPASPSAIDQVAGELFRAHIRTSVEVVRGGIGEEGRSMDQDCVPALYRERQLTGAVAKALIRPDGTVNRALIPALCDKLREYKPALGSFALQHMLKVLLEVRHDERIHRVLRNTAEPCEAFQPLVRMATQSDPHSVVGQKESVITILSALLTPIRQMPGFGSCQTTASLAAICNASLPIAIRDLQEILHTGKIIREVLGEQVSYLAVPEVYPVADAETLINPYGFHIRDRAREAARLVQELSRGVLFLAYQDLAHVSDTPQARAACARLIDDCLKRERKKTQISYGTILNYMISQYHPDAAGAEMVRTRVHFNVQHPLLSAWENCICGMHCSSSLKEEFGGKNDFLWVPIGARRVTWHTMFMQAMKEFVEIDMHDANTALSQAVLANDVRLYPIKCLRFACTPPQTRDTGKWQLQLYYEDEQHEWHSISDAATFQRRLKEVFQAITGKVITDAAVQQLHNRMIAKLAEQQAPKEACWRFQTTPYIYNSKMQIIYFGKDSQSFDRPFYSTDVKAEIEAFRQFALEKKQEYGNCKNIGCSVSALVPEAHIFQPHISTSFLTQPEKAASQWLQDKESYLHSIKAAQVPNVVHAVCRKVVDEYLSRTSAKEQRAFTAHMQQKMHLPFFSWCRELGTTLIRYRAREKHKKALSQEKIGQIERMIVNQMNIHYPKLYRQCILPFGNSNYSAVDATEGACVPIYYCFAFMPSLQGVAAWKKLAISKRYRANKEREISQQEVFELEMNQPGHGVSLRWKERARRLQYARHSAALERHMRTFCAAWEEVARERGVPGVSRAKKRMLAAHRRYHRQVEQAKREKIYLAPDMVLARADSFPREALQALLGPSF